MGKNGDCFDRYRIRVEEMRQSLHIIHQCISQMPAGPVATPLYKIAPSSQTQLKYNMEAVINHFKYFTMGFKVPAGFAAKSVEAPKGEFGIFICSTGGNKPYRCKIKAPGFLHLQGLEMMSQGHMLADIVANIGTLDIVFGEVDR